MSISAAYAVPHPPLLIPGVGESKELRVQTTEDAFEEIASRCAALEPETLVFFSPHATLYADYFHISPGTGAHGDFSRFGAPQAAYAVTYDEEFVRELEVLLAKKGIAGGTAGERDATLDHGVMVPLHFIGKAASDEGGAGRGVKVVRIGLSGLSEEMHREFGAAVAEVAAQLNRKTVVIASGDLSHKLLADGPYGYAPEGPEFDKQICAALAQGDVQAMLRIDENLSEAAAECGLRSFIMMGGALEACKHKGCTYTSELLSYEGPFGVGYAVAAYAVEPSLSAEDASAEECNPEHTSARGAAAEAADDKVESERMSTMESLPVALAYQTLKSYFELGGKRPSLETPEIAELLIHYKNDPSTAELYEDLAHKQAGAFVSLHEAGELRGCIGTIAATQDSVLAEIVRNAVSAAEEDPRFPPVQESELPFLDIKVDILGDAEPVVDRSTLDAERYGVIVSLGYRRGLLLPALEGVDTPDEQIAIALSKAGISAHEPYELERFEVVRYT